MTATQRLRHSTFTSLLFLLWGLGILPGLPPFLADAMAAGVTGPSAQVLMEKDSVSVGEPIHMQVRVEGSDMPPGTEPPDVSGIADFTVEFLGGQKNNSSSITIVNGKVDKIETRGYIYSYRLTPKKVGRFEIPPLAVPLDERKSKTVLTQPVSIQVGEPEASDDFHLELKFAKTRFYVGEPVVLTVVWYIGRDVESVVFNLPILQDPTFASVDPKADQDPRKQYFQIPVSGSTIVAEKGSGVYSGREYTTLSFRKVLFAKNAGVVETPGATVSCRALVGYSNRQRKRGPFNGFFDDDFFNPMKRGVYKTLVTSAKPTTLKILALPEDGRPPGFAGWVGNFQLRASASPTEVNVGDPITLSLSVTGSEYLDHVELPPLAKDTGLEESFKIPDDMAAGVVTGTAKEFTQTIRPKSDDVKAIPSVKIPYFDPDTGRYAIAESNPIPLTVKATRILTAADVEGQSGEAAAKKSELENWAQGIAHNYEGPEILDRQEYRISKIVGSPLWLAVTLVPFLAFVALLAYLTVRQKVLSDPHRSRSNKAFPRFKQKVRVIEVESLGHSDTCSALLNALKTYLGDKTGSTRSGLTSSEAAESLLAKGIPPGVAARLKDLIDACEEGSYGGIAGEKTAHELAAEALDLVRSLDQLI